MRILLAYGLVGRGGDAVQVLEIAEAFRRLGHSVELLGPTQLRPYDFTSSEAQWRGALRRLPWWSKDLIELCMDWHLGHQARRLLQERSFELILHRAGIYDTVGVWLAEVAGCPLVVWLDAPFPLERAFRNESYFKNLHRRYMLKLGQKTQRIVTVSRASKEYYVQLGLPEEKIMVLPNGIPERLLRLGIELARQPPPFSQGKEQCVIGFVGSLSRWHGVSLLLQTLRELGAPEDSRWKMKVVGFGEEYAKLRAQARQLKVETCIEWLGALPHDQAFEQIAQFDIAVLPHTLPTGAPMKLFEYAAVARPTIAPNLPNLRELFAEDEMCFVPPQSSQALAEAILWLPQHPQEALQMGQRAQARVQQYTWEEIIRKLLESLSRLS